MGHKCSDLFSCGRGVCVGGGPAALTGPYRLSQSPSDRCKPRLPRPTALQDAFGLGQARLPRSSYLYLCRTVVRSVAASYVKLFLPEGAVKAYNLFAIKQLSGDLVELQVASSRGVDR